VLPVFNIRDIEFRDRCDNLSGHVYQQYQVIMRYLGTNMGGQAVGSLLWIRRMLDAGESSLAHRVA